MLSIFKIFFIGLTIGFTSISFSAVPQRLKFCRPEFNLEIFYELVDKKISLEIRSTDLDIKPPYKGAISFNLKDSYTFPPKEYVPFSLEEFHRLTGLTSYTVGTVLYANYVDNGNLTQLFFFEFSPNQYALVWAFEDQMKPFIRPIKLGRTDLCK